MEISFPRMIEQDLIQGCINNDASAQRELYNLYSPKMLSLCYRFAYNRIDAQDMLQDAFIKIFTQIHTFKNKGSFEGWIRRIVIHSCINFLKRNKKFTDNIELDYAENIHIKHENISNIILVKQIIECIRLLPIGYRTVLNLYAIEGYSHKEIGELLDIQESSSRSQYARARVLLENILIKKQIIPEEKENLNWLADLK
ncbi:MAG: sigma-70 family RNA polymerase sigma factor [Chitinophagales bacterium]|nr:sigma-70 family RNA polymerase sigma factor [Chitinophagales bacterium]